MRQSIKKNIFLFLIIFLILLGFPIKGYARYVPYGSSYEVSNGSFANKSRPGTLKIGYLRANNNDLTYVSIPFSTGHIVKEGDSSYYTQTGDVAKSKVQTVYPSGCSSADIYRECSYERNHDKDDRPTDNYYSSITGYINFINITGTVNYGFIYYQDGEKNTDDDTIYVCSSHTYGGYTTVKDSTC